MPETLLPQQPLNPPTTDIPGGKDDNVNMEDENVTMEDVQQEVQPNTNSSPSSTTLANIQTAEEHKTTGNTFFQQGEYRKALGSYHRVFLYLNTMKDDEEAGGGGSDMGTAMARQTMESIPVSHKQSVRKLKTVTWTNMANCYLKLHEINDKDDQSEQNRLLDKAIEVCKKAVGTFGPSSVRPTDEGSEVVGEIEINGYSKTKPLFRLGQVLLIRDKGDDVGGAYDALLEAARISPNDRVIREEYEKARARKKEQEKEFGAMIGRGIGV